MTPGFLILHKHHGLVVTTTAEGENRLLARLTAKIVVPLSPFWVSETYNGALGSSGVTRDYMRWCFRV